MGGRAKLLFFEEQQQDYLAMAFCEASKISTLGKGSISCYGNIIIMTFEPDRRDFLCLRQFLSYLAAGDMGALLPWLVFL